MSAGAPWSVKGIDPKAREIAKDLARRQGLTVGDLLNRTLEGLAQEGSRAPPDRERPARRQPLAVASAAPTPVAAEELRRLKESLDRIDGRMDAAEHRSTLAISGIDQAVVGLLARLETAEREHVAVAARFEGALQEIRSDQAKAEARLAKAEEAAAHPRSAEALRSLEAALGKVASHLYDSETRTHATLEEMRGDLDGLRTNMSGVEGADLGPSQVMIDGVVSRIVQRLEEAEARTSSAIRTLESSIGDFDRRLTAAEGAGDTPQQNLVDLADDLLRNFDVARAELSQQLEQKTDARLEAMERSVREMSGQVAAAGQRSTQAMERMGREVLRVAEALGRRMEGVEARGAQAVQQVGDEISRIADVMEGRLRKADQVQAESLERLGAEIARITERLAERIGAAERRSAQAIDDVGEQVSRVTDKLNQRSERASSDLAERIRQSEERTAKLLEEAREKLDQRLAMAERRLMEQAPAPTPPPLARVTSSDPISLFAETDLPPGPFGLDEEPELEDPPLRADEFAPSSFQAAAFSATPEARRAPAGFVPPVESLPEEPERSPFEGDDFDIASMFESFNAEAEEGAEEPLEHEPDALDIVAYAQEPDAPVEPAFAEPEDAPPIRASTRELIEQARAAARAAVQEGESGGQKRSLFSGFGLGAKKGKKSAAGLKSAMTISAAAAVLGVGALGAVIYTAQLAPRAHTRPGATDAAAPAPAPEASADAETTGQPAGGQASPAFDPHAGQAQAPAGVDLAGLYADGVRRVEGRDSRGVADIRRAADLGYGPAQFYLAKLYEDGQAGLPKDAAQARRWTERAARSGERGAMHNLALYYYEGVGGAKNPAAAGEWFRRAAQLGLVDSQYNLAKLYEGGYGVSQNPAEAYKWYLIAARSGDTESHAAADRLKLRLSADAQDAARRAADAFHPDLPAQTVAAAALTR
jgi:localization factor PodJL